MKKEAIFDLVTWVLLVFASLYLAITVFRAAVVTHGLFVIVMIFLIMIILSIMKIIEIVKLNKKNHESKS